MLEFELQCGTEFCGLCLMFLLQFVLLDLCCYGTDLFVPSYLKNGRMLVFAQWKSCFLGFLVALILKFHLKCENEFWSMCHIFVTYFTWLNILYSKFPLAVQKIGRAHV